MKENELKAAAEAIDAILEIPKDRRIDVLALVCKMFIEDRAIR